MQHILSWSISKLPITFLNIKFFTTNIENFTKKQIKIRKLINKETTNKYVEMTKKNIRKKLREVKPRARR